MRAHFKKIMDPHVLRLRMCDDDIMCDAFCDDVCDDVMCEDQNFSVLV